MPIVETTLVTTGIGATLALLPDVVTSTLYYAVSRLLALGLAIFLYGALNLTIYLKYFHDVFYFFFHPVFEIFISIENSVLMLDYLLLIITFKFFFGLLMKKDIQPSPEEPPSNYRPKSYRSKPSFGL